MFTSLDEAQEWLEHYEYAQTGLVLSKYTGFIAIEVLSAKGHLLLSLYANGALPPTWEYQFDDSHFYIYRLSNTIDVKHEFIFTTLNGRDDIIIRGFNNYVPIPPIEDKDYLECRSPRHSTAFQIPLAPSWVVQLMAKDTGNLDSLTGQGASFDSDLTIYLKENLLMRSSVNLKHNLRPHTKEQLYKAYVYISIDNGWFPVDFKVFNAGLNALRFSSLKQASSVLPRVKKNIKLDQFCPRPSSRLEEVAFMLFGEQPSQRQRMIEEKNE